MQDAIAEPRQFLVCECMARGSDSPRAFISPLMTKLLVFNKLINDANFKYRKSCSREMQVTYCTSHPSIFRAEISSFEMNMEPQSCSFPLANEWEGSSQRSLSR